MAEYHTGRNLQAYAILYADAQLTWLQDPGAITEVLSCEFFEPLGRSSSHQLWSSAMLFSPSIRGLAGIESDALNHSLTINPQLPADWDEISLEHVAVGNQSFRIQMKRVQQHLEIDVSSATPAVLCLTQSAATAPCASKPEMHHHTSLELPEVEVIVQHQPPIEGERTSSLKVIDQKRGDHDLTLMLKAPAGTTQYLKLRRNDSTAHNVMATGGVLQGDDLSIDFAPSSDREYKTAAITLSW